MIAALIIFAYVLGSIPVGLIVGKLWKGVDIRNYGSGNIGATNTLRALGPGPAAVVFSLDVVKGLVPVLAVRHFVPGAPTAAVIAGLVAILGHTFSVFLSFKGGKGVATSLGVIIGLDWRVACVGFALWVVVVGITKFVSLASIIAAASMPALMFAFHAPTPYKVFGIAAAAFVIAKHRSNIVRLAQGKEARWGEKVKVTEG
ncbi:MAG: glycerol-3-phosphate 1-O-acyltransferase PlsY [Armatimonadota bacterium]